MRAVIYARYSSDAQNFRSIDDQVHLCRQRIEAQGWTEVEVYTDAAISGASDHGPGYQRLRADAAENRFDVVVCEALDRLARNLGNIAKLNEHLQFHGVGIHTLNVGDISQMHIGMLGTMSEMYLSDLRDKTRRGLQGVVRDGRIAAGPAYGYDLIGEEDGAGHRRINKAQAEVVIRIFEAYAAGQSPRAIAKALNADGVPGPRGGKWRDTTIRGQVARGTGILNNDLYAGRIVWNRCSYVKNPNTGKRVPRPNPPEEHITTEAPELQIVDHDLWNRVKERQKAVHFQIARDERGNALNAAHRKRYLLSGLLVCGVCGGPVNIMGKDRYGCATHRGLGTCDNDRTIKRQEIERRVLAGIKNNLLEPDMVEAFIAAYKEEHAKARQEADASRIRLEEELTETDRKIDGIVRAIEEGVASRTLAGRLKDLEARKDELEAHLWETIEDDTVVAFHPNLAQIYKQKVAALEEALDDPLIRTEAAETLRGLVDRVTLTPSTEGGFDVELEGDLARILAFADGDGLTTKHPGSVETGFGLSVVAGAGFEPATFRL